MKRHPPFFAAGNRIAFQWDRLDMPAQLNEKMALKALYKIGFQHIKVNLVALAREQMHYSFYKRGAKIAEAPGVVSGSSWIKWLFAQRGIRLPRNTIQQYRLRTNDRTLQRPVIQYKIDGALIFTKGALFNAPIRPGNRLLGHVGLMTAKDTIIHAWPGLKVSEDKLAEHLAEYPLVETLMIHDEKKAKTLIIPPGREIESTDDLRWLILKEFDMLQEF